MNTLRILLMALLMVGAFFSVGCEGDDPGPNLLDPAPIEEEEEQEEEEEEEEQEENRLNGTYQGNDTVSIVVTITNNGTDPITETCEGSVTVTVDTDGNPQLTGTGDCLLPANFVSYTLDGDVTTETEASGTMTIRMNNRDHLVNWTGSFQDDTVTITFDELTPHVGALEIQWDGTASATLE